MEIHHNLEQYIIITKLLHFPYQILNAVIFLKEDNTTLDGSYSIYTKTVCTVENTVLANFWKKDRGLLGGYSLWA